jgi:hypothetical protein
LTFWSQRPEVNITRFISAEPSIASKSLELRKEAAPCRTRIAIIFDPEARANGPSYISLIEPTALELGIAAIKMPIRTAVDIVRAIDVFKGS